MSRPGIPVLQGREDVNAAPIRAITIQQPWASAIIHGSKRVENRSRPWPLGPYLIHAGKTWDDDAEHDPTCRAWMTEHDRPGRTGGYAPGAVLGVATIVDCHRAAPGCCDSPWGWTPDADEACRNHHLVMDGVRALAEPIPCRGALGPWVPPGELVEAVRSGLQAALGPHPAETSGDDPAEVTR